MIGSIVASSSSSCKARFDVSGDGFDRHEAEPEQGQRFGSAPPLYKAKFAAPAERLKVRHHLIDGDLRDAFCCRDRRIMTIISGIQEIAEFRFMLRLFS